MKSISVRCFVIAIKLLILPVLYPIFVDTNRVTALVKILLNGMVVAGLIIAVIGHALWLIEDNRERKELEHDNGN